MKVDVITIVGGGSSGWMTAASLIKAFPNKKINVIESKDVPIIGVGESTLGWFRRWTEFIGLDESSFFPKTDASYKLSIKFTDFYKENSGSFHYPFGFPHSINPKRNAFQDWHLKKYFDPNCPTEDFVRCLFPGAALFENNKFSDNLNGELDNFNPKTNVAYHFDATKFGIWLRENYCIPAGVNHIVGTVTSISTNDDGIEYLLLDNGDKITSDLFVDCTGFKSLLLSETLKEPFKSYSDILPNNKAWATRVPYKNRSVELEGFTNCTAIENGWCWNIPLWSRLGTGYVYSDKFVSKEDALKEFKNYLMSSKMKIPRTEEEVESLEYKEITMRVGIHERTFVKNVVAIGLSAGFIEPLESNGLFSVHEFLFKLIDILQRGHINQFDRDMYNVTVYEIFDSFAKFVALHYALSHREETEYWKEVNKKTFIDDSKKGTFYDMIDRYMISQQHPLDENGIPYIATGMNLNLFNLSRVSRNVFNEDPLKAIQEIDVLWHLKKFRWNEYAKRCPTLEEYLYNKFYKERENDQEARV